MLPAPLSKADLHLLHVFVSVVDAKGYSAAQAELNVAPSTISRQISDLEIRLGMTLCQRGRSGFRLTEDGKLVYRATQRLFGAVREFGETIDASRGKLTGTLAVSVIDNWVFNEKSPFAQAFKAFVRKAPDVFIDLFAQAPDDIEMSVLDGRVHIGVGVFHKHKPGLTYVTLGYEKMGLYCAKGHPLYDVEDDQEIDALLNKSFYAKRAYLRERDVAPVSRNLEIKAHAHQIEGIAHLILTGTFVGYLPEHFADYWLQSGKMKAVGDGRYDRTSEIKLVKKNDASPYLAARTLEKMMHDFAQDPVA
jgi:DNA-binding transcriptional LysR family regulator